MQPPAARSSPSCLQTRASSSTTSNLLHQQPQSFYGPVTTLQPFTAVLHPPCVYPAAQRNTGPLSPALLTTQGNKINEWQTKNKPQGQHQRNQRQLFYTTKPSFPFEQPQIAPPPPTTPSTYLLTPSNFCHGPYSADHYNNSAVTVISQPYFKPPEMQALCLLQDRQVISQQQTQQYNPYYNLSTTNACTLQTVTANTNLQLPNQMGSYTPFANNQLPLQTSQIFPNPPQNQIGNSPNETRSSASTLDFPPLKYSRNKFNTVTGKIPSPVSALPRENVDWPPQIGKLSNTFNIPSADYKDFCAEIVQSQANSSSKTQEERFSDESSASFDFTIEAEKMVSALCNTTSSNDLGNIEIGKNESSTLFSGAGDNVPSKETWLSNYSVDNATVDLSSGRSVATQTQEVNSENNPELIRKTTLWGCSQAESLLNSGRSRDSKHEWLMNLSVATRTAITKSSTCFPVYAGDQTLVQDLINSLLRISNGWLILDNYINKQHYPSLNDKYDRDLIKSFQDWERTTHELLKNIIKTFLQLEENLDQEERIDTSGTSGTFPGDVSMYTTYDLFEPPLKINLAPGSSVNQESSQNLKNFHYFADLKKETKLRGKWTITENVSTGVENSKTPDVSLNRVDAGIHVSRFRTKGNVSSIKSTSLNAEFFHLRNKVLENKSPDANRQWHLKERKQDLNLNRTCSKPASMDSVFRHKFGNESQDACSSQLSRIDTSFNSSGNMDPLYVNTSPSNNYPTCKTYTDLQCFGKKKRCFDSNCESNLGQILSANAVYVGKSSDQLEFATIPINKMTLLSQIEPNTAVPNKEEMTANLSAWFASMRNVNITTIPNSDLKVENLSKTYGQEVTRNKMDPTRQLQLDGNRQLLSLQNMQSIQSAPWNACNLISNRSVQQTHDEYDSSEDVRIYMKPGSYNVPKKRHQRRCNRRSENTTSRLGVRHSNKDRFNPSTSFPASRVVDTNASSGLRTTFPINPTVSSSNFLKTSPRINQRSDSPSEDVAWKAACDSAEILLEALNVKESLSLQMDEQRRSKEGSEDQITGGQNQVCRDQIRSNQDQMIRDQNQMFRNQNQMVRNQDQMMRHLDQKIRDQMIRNQGKMIRNQDKMIRDQDQMVRDDMIRSQDQMVRDDMIRSQDQMVRDDIIRSQDQMVRDDMIRSQDQMVRDDIIRSQDQMVRDMIRSQDQMVRDDMIRSQEQMVRDDMIRSQDQMVRDDMIRSQEQLIREKIIRNQDQMLRDQDQKIRDQMIRNQDQKSRNQDQKSGNQDQKIRDRMIRNQDQIIRNQGQKQRRSMSRKQRDEEDCDASSYEASEDDSESSYKISHSIGPVGLNRFNDIKLRKTNVRTDSWLIRTLNNASIIGQTQCRENDLASSDSLNSSLHEDEQIDRVNVVASTPATTTSEKISNTSSKDLFPNFLKSKEVPCENVGKATYSETVRRSAASNLGKKEPCRKGTSGENESIMCGTILPLPGRKSHRKDVEKSYLLHKSRKAMGKKILKDQEVEVQGEENLKTKFPGDEISLGSKFASGKGHGKKKDTTAVLDGKNKSTDRGWSVWYSSRRKQMLSPLALNKLETIHQAVWQMDEACVFKYPSSAGLDTSSNKAIDDYCKIVKNPMFLETIGYKLKNRVYHKVEHAVKDFRRIVCNSRLYHKNDGVFSSKIETLSKKLEELFEEHFANLDFENVISPRDISPVSQRVKLQSQRNRCNINKKCPSGSGKTENANEHFKQN